MNRASPYFLRKLSALRFGDPVVLLVVDRSDVQVVLEFLEGLLDFGEDDVLLPQLFGVVGGEVGAQQVGAFPTTGLS